MMSASLPVVIKLVSSCLATATYDDGHLQLRIHFHDGSAYDYQGVPPALFASLADAPSQGSFFNLHIRDRFPCARVNEN